MRGACGCTGWARGALGTQGAGHRAQDAGRWARDTQALGSRQERGTGAGRRAGYAYGRAGGHAGGRAERARRARNAGGPLGARGARHGRWERDLGVLLGCRLCTWCTQPVFNPILTQYCS